MDPVGAGEEDHAVAGVDRLLAVGAAQGAEEATREVEKILPQLEARGWHDLTQDVQRLLDGERDTDELCANLDREGSYIIRAILAQLAGDQTF